MSTSESPSRSPSNGPAASPPGKARWVRMLIIYPAVAVAAYLFTILLIRSLQRGGLPPGEPLPEITAAGWLNGEPPDADERAGKVVVVHAWFANCPHCHREAPELVNAYRRFRDRGVVFIGLSPDDEESVESDQRFLDKFDITWPNGYGAIETLEKLFTDGPRFPSLWVVGFDGRVRWNRAGGGTLEDAIERALAEVRARR